MGEVGEEGVEAGTARDSELVLFAGSDDLVQANRRHAVIRTNRLSGKAVVLACDIATTLKIEKRCED